MIFLVEGHNYNNRVALLTKIAHDLVRDNTKVLSNLDLKCEYTKFDFDYLVDHMETHELEQCTIMLDSYYKLIDSRTSGSKANKLFNYFVFQSRQRQVDIFIGAENEGDVDIRLRHARDFLIAVSPTKDGYIAGSSINCHNMQTRTFFIAIEDYFAYARYKEEVLAPLNIYKYLGIKV